MIIIGGQNEEKNSQGGLAFTFFNSSLFGLGLCYDI